MLHCSHKIVVYLKQSAARKPAYTHTHTYSYTGSYIYITRLKFRSPTFSGNARHLNTSFSGINTRLNNTNPTGLLAVAPTLHGKEFRVVMFVLLVRDVLHLSNTRFLTFFSLSRSRRKIKGKSHEVYLLHLIYERHLISFCRQFFNLL